MIFKVSFPLAMYQRVKLSATATGATFIQGAIFIVFATLSRGYV
jgi:hypothetical protein